MEYCVSVGIFLHKLGNFLPNLYLLQNRGFDLQRPSDTTGECASMQKIGEVDSTLRLRIIGYAGAQPGVLSHAA
jgi:hypothetical protein